MERNDVAFGILVFEPGSTSPCKIADTLTSTENDKILGTLISYSRLKWKSMNRVDAVLLRGLPLP